MIVSHLRKFIFVKGHKVASTSVEIALSQICGPDDIITPITPVDEKLRLGGGGVARNYSDDPELERAFAEDVATKEPEQIGPIPRRVRFRNHMSLREARAELNGLEGYRVLFVDRNPYEKVLSLANWRRGIKAYTAGQALSRSTDGLADKVNKLIRNGNALTVRNIDLYKDEDGKVPVKGWRFETVGEELRGFFEELGVAPVALPHAKAGLGMKAAEVRELLAPEHIAYINEEFAEEFDTFGYERVA